jgi:hypothetical protein
MADQQPTTSDENTPVTPEERTQAASNAQRILGEQLTSELSEWLTVAFGHSMTARQLSDLMTLVGIIAGQRSSDEGQVRRRTMAEWAQAETASTMQLPPDTSLGVPTPTSSPTPDQQRIPEGVPIGDSTTTPTPSGNNPRHGDHVVPDITIQSFGNTDAFGRPVGQQSGQHHHRIQQDGLYEPTIKQSSIIGEIPEYKGDRKEDAAAHWLRQCETHFQDRIVVNRWATDELTRVILARVKLRGHAKQMWDAREQHVATGRLPTISAWGEFRQWITESFEEVDANRRRLDNWAKIKQGTNGVQSHALAVQKAAFYLEPQLPEEHIVNKMIESLKPELRARWEGSLDQPNVWADAVKILIRFERAILAEKGILGASARGSADDYGDPMDLSAIVAGGNRPKKDSAAWKPWCLKHRACFNCGDTGHPSRNCRRKKGNKKGDRKESQEKEDDH